MDTPNDTNTTTGGASTAQIVSLLQSLADPNSTKASFDSRQLTIHLRSPLILPLSNILYTHVSASVRNLAAVLLRTHQLVHLNNLPHPALSTFIKTLLHRLFHEPHTPTRRAIIALYSDLYFHEHQSFFHLHQPIQLALLHSSESSLRAQALLFPHLSSNTFLTALDDNHPTVQYAALDAFAIATRRPTRELAQVLPCAIDLVSRVSQTNDMYHSVSSSLYEAFTNFLPTSHFRPYFERAFRHAIQTFTSAPLEAAASALQFLTSACETKPYTIKNHATHHDAVSSACTILLKHSIGKQNTDINPLSNNNRSFLAITLLDALAVAPQLSTSVFSQAYATVVNTVSSKVSPNFSDSRTLIGCFSIIQALADGCSEQITAHAREIVTIVLGRQYEHVMSADTGVASLDTLMAITMSLHTDYMSDELSAYISDQCLAAVVRGLRHAALNVSRAACRTLPSVISLFKRHHASDYAEQVVNAIAALHTELAIEAVTAISALAEDASKPFVSSSHFQELVRRTVETMICTTSYHNRLDTIASYEAATALVTVSKQVDVVNLLARHVLNGIHSDDCILKQSALSFFTQLASSIGGSSLFLYGNRVLISAIESLEQKDTLIAAGQPSIAEINVNENDDIDTNGQHVYKKIVAIECIGALATVAATDEFIQNLQTLPDSGKSIIHLLGTAMRLVEVETSSSQSTIRVHALRTCSQLATADMQMREKRPNLGFCSLSYVDKVLCDLLRNLRGEDDISVVTDVANVLCLHLSNLSPHAILRCKEDIIDTIKLLLLGNAECQTWEKENEEESDVDDEEWKGDDTDNLIETVGEVIEGLVRATRGYFAGHFIVLIQQLLETLHGPRQSGRNRGMVLGTISSILLFMRWDQCPFLPPSMNDPSYELPQRASHNLAAAALTPALESVGSAKSPTLQRNAVILLGLLFECSRSSNIDVWIRLPEARKTLEEIAFAAKGLQGALKDEAIVSISRIAMAIEMPAGATFHRVQMLQEVLGSMPLKHVPTKNVAIARMIIRAADSGIIDVLQWDIVLKVSSCLVTAVLQHLKNARCKSLTGVICTGTSDSENWHFDEKEFGKAVGILQQMQKEVGESIFDEMRLSPKDLHIITHAIGG